MLLFVINYDEVFGVAYDVTGETTPIIDSIVLISLPSVTHCFDSNQRYIILDFPSFYNIWSFRCNCAFRRIHCSSGLLHTFPFAG
ncbi:MAG: DUF1929 domain-containing protein [Ignavibacteria bacterium]|nr:DUF1929 domain-containing protein [Ignavibacteria bacterium]